MEPAPSFVTSNTLPDDGAQPKPPETFHYFPRLPSELRVIIWKMALHPPGFKRWTRYLTLFESTGDRKSPLRDFAVPDRQFSEYEKEYLPLLPNIEYKVTAPRVTAHGSQAHAPE